MTLGCATGLIYNIYRDSKLGTLFIFPVVILGCYFLMSMVLALLEMAYKEHQEEANSQKRTQTQMALCASYVLLWYKANAHLDSDKEDLTPACDTMSKDVFLAYTEQLLHLPPAASNLIFASIDMNQSGTVELGEVQQLLFLCRCHKLLEADELVRHKVIFASKQVLLERTIRQLEHVPASAEFDQARTRLLADLVEQEKAAEEAEIALEAYTKCVLDSLRFFCVPLHHSEGSTTLVAMVCCCFSTIIQSISDMFCRRMLSSSPLTPVGYRGLVWASTCFT